MSQESKSSSEHQTHSSSATTYRCFSCGHDIEDRVYFVQRRRIRSSKELGPLVDNSHGGVILGPEFDPYCSTCYGEIPTIQELISNNKRELKDNENS